MSTEQVETPQWGAPPPPARARWTAKRIVVTVAIALGIAAAGSAAIYAASGSTTAAQGGPGGGRGGPGGGPMLVGGPMGDMSATQHGEFQTGEVTGITDDEITTKSEDGYTRTYAITQETKSTGDIAKGDDVTVIATTEGTTATAESIMEMGTMPQRRNGNGAPPGN
jgi:hypothetical protein